MDACRLSEESSAIHHQLLKMRLNDELSESRCVGNTPAGGHHGSGASRASQSDPVPR